MTDTLPLPAAPPIPPGEESSVHETVYRALKANFGFDAFRPGQEAVVAEAVAGRNVLGVMPTGTGKSLCYQLTAILRPGGTLVISPLIALMKDQVDSLSEVAGLRVGILNSSIGRSEQEGYLRAWEEGELDILYAAPERFRNRRFLDALTKRAPEVLAVDEAHCVSQWGHDFRPDYLFLRTAIHRLRVPVTMALTATATPEVQADILEQLGLPDASVIVSGFDRPNLYMEVHRLASDRAKRDRLKELLAESAGSGIIYCGTRKEALATAEFVRSLGRTASAYSGELEADARSAIQTGFMRGDIEIICATNAFGLGVNKQNIAFVHHVALPGTIEALYQEMGRAGRNGDPARCALLFAPNDLSLQRFFIQSATPTRKDLTNLYGFLCSRGPSPEFTWDQAAGLMDASDVKVRSTLSELEKAGLARRMADAPDGAVRVQLVESQYPERALREREGILEAIRAERMRKLQAVETYARLMTCRRAYVRRYFGEENVPETCRACDVCAPRRAPVSVPVPENVDRRTDVAETILRCVQRFNGRLGRAKIAQILAGSKSKGVADSEWFADWLGRLNDIPQVRITEGIEELMTDGWLESGVLSRNEQAFPVLQLSPEGWKVVKGEMPPPSVGISRAPAPLAASAKPDAAGHPADAEGQVLYERLRKWRMDQARELQWSAFMILSDAVLREIVAHRPQTEEDLLAVKGMGPGKVERWGGDVLGIVAAAGRSAQRLETGSVAGVIAGGPQP